MVAGSVAVTPNSNACAARAEAIDITAPAASPMTSSRDASLMTMRVTSARFAPSAMRMPISLRRRATMYDMTPYRPMTASTTASGPKNADSVAISRSRRNDWRMSPPSVR